MIASKIIECRDMILAALAAGVGISTIFALVIVGATGVTESRRDGSTIGTVVYGVLTTVCLLGFFAAVVFGVTVITDKD